MNSRAPGANIERCFVRLALVAVAITTGGCPFIIPTPGAQINAPAEDVVQIIKPQVTTRTDVLMMLGDPNFRLGDDRYFVYDWSDVHVVFGAFVIPYGDPLVGGLGHSHALAIEFAADSRVARLKEFAIMGTERESWELIRQWIRASDGTAR